MSLMYSGLSAIEDGKVDEVEITREWEGGEGVHVVLRRDMVGRDINGFFNPVTENQEES